MNGNNDMQNWYILYTVGVLEYLKIPRHHSYPQNIRKNLWIIWKIFRPFLFIYCNNTIIGTKYCNDCDSAIYLDSVILNATWTCSFKYHIIGLLSHILVYQVCDFDVLTYLGDVGLCHFLHKWAYEKITSSYFLRILNNSAIFCC